MWKLNLPESGTFISVSRWSSNEAGSSFRVGVSKVFSSFRTAPAGRLALEHGVLGWRRPLPPVARK